MQPTVPGTITFDWAAGGEPGALWSTAADSGGFAVRVLIQLAPPGSCPLPAAACERHTEPVASVTAFAALHGVCGDTTIDLAERTACLHADPAARPAAAGRRFPADSSGDTAQRLADAAAEQVADAVSGSLELLRGITTITAGPGGA